MVADELGCDVDPDSLSRDELLDAVAERLLDVADQDEDDDESDLAANDREVVDAELAEPR